MDLEYKTAAEPACAEFTERRSRFLGYIRPVVSEEQAAAFLSEIRSKHWDATHHVYAYVLRDGQTRRYSDDGEPQGTAGMPVLDVLLKSGVTDTAAVVVRYFGGVLLGAGGLVRAYSHAVSLALKESKIAVMRRCLKARIPCTYSQYSRVAALVAEQGGTIDQASFLETVMLEIHISPSRLPHLTQALADATCGQCQIEPKGEAYYSEKMEEEILKF